MVKVLFLKEIKILRLKLFVCASVKGDCWSCFFQQLSLYVGVKHEFFRHLPRFLDPFPESQALKLNVELR